METSRQIRWGILGNANIARVCVAPAIAKSRNGTLAAVASRQASRAAELADQHGAAAVEGYQQLLDDPSIDAVYIPLLNHLHLPWTLKALAAGKHVLVEKPIALNATEAAQMAEAAQQADRQLMEAFMWRFHPRSIRIKELVTSGALGAIGSIRAAFTFPVTQDESNGRLFSAETGGGSLLDVGSYCVSVARWMLDAEPLRVSATAIWQSGVDVNFVGTLEFASGALAVVESGFKSALQQTYTILGDKAAITLPHDAFVPWEKDAAFEQRAFDQELGETIVTSGADEYQLMVEHFANAILAGEAVAFSAEDSVKQMRVLDALKLAAQTGKTITL